MALSLLHHIKDTQASALNRAIQEMGLSATQANTLLEWSLPLVLAHLVDLNQRHGTGLVLALINTQAVDGIWQTLDQAEWISQTQKYIVADTLVLQVASHHIATTVLAEIFELVDAASLGEEGLNELLQGQLEHLQGQAPDWVWQQAGLTDLCGQIAPAAEQDTALDLTASIASLNQLVRQAATQAQSSVSEAPMTSLDLNKSTEHLDDAHDASHASHHTIEIPVQRVAGRNTRMLEPLIALGILYFLYALFCQSSLQVDAKPAQALPASAETVLVPTLLTDESQLPPMGNAADQGAAQDITQNTAQNTAQNNGMPDPAAIERATADAQRTGAQALQFSDNSLSD